MIFSPNNKVVPTKETYLLAVLVVFILIGVGYAMYSKTAIVESGAVLPKAKLLNSSSILDGKLEIPMSYYTNIIKDTKENENFRRVLFTGPKSQLVVMSIPPGGEVGEETHKYTEQTLFFLSGTGEGSLDDKKFPIGPGDVVVVTAGTKHNFRNTGKEDLKIYTVYAPPNHIDGRIHRTKAEADTDIADEAIGESAPLK